MAEWREVEITCTKRVRILTTGHADALRQGGVIGRAWVPAGAVPGDTGTVRVCVLRAGDAGQQEAIRLG